MHTKKHTGGENLPTKEPPTGETEVQQETLHKGRKGNPRVSRQGDQRDFTTESHRTPITEVHPIEVRQAKQSNLRCRNKQKEPPKMGRQRNKPQLKGKVESPGKELNEIEASNLS